MDPSSAPDPAFAAFEAAGRRYACVDLPGYAGQRLEAMPFCRRVLLESVLRRRGLDCGSHAEALIGGATDREILFEPGRVLTTDFSGLPTVLDLVAVEDAVSALAGGPRPLRLTRRADLVIDHSISVDFDGARDALPRNIALEYRRNGERYRFLKWGAKRFEGIRVVPPGKGICHQVNLEHLSEVVTLEAKRDPPLAILDTVVGTDSHTTMVNGLGVLGWGVGGIEATAALLGQPIPLLAPPVTGLELIGRLPTGVTATDLVLTITEQLRSAGVVGQFVEFFGDGLEHLPIPDRATIANMAPEYGATCGYFPIDGRTLDYLAAVGRARAHIELVEAYARRQRLFRDSQAAAIAYDRRLQLHLSEVEPVVAGPRRPSQRTSLAALPAAFDAAFPEAAAASPRAAGELDHGDVVIAAITSCTNTANPRAMLAAGLVAARARARGLQPHGHIKASLAPGSQVVADYLELAGLMPHLEHFGFFLAGLGCTTCIGNSGPLAEPLAAQIAGRDLAVAAVLSGNRNFEGRIAPNVRANFLASPPLVVAYAIAGTVRKNLTSEPLAHVDGAPVFLADIWPSDAEVDEVVRRVLSPELFARRRAALFKGDEAWNAIEARAGAYEWDARSSYIRRPPFLDRLPAEPPPLARIVGARALAVLGDSVTTDLIAPAGAIRADSPAAIWLGEHGVPPVGLHTYGARRGAHEVVARGALGNPRLQNQLAVREGSWTRHLPSGEEMSIWDAATRYAEERTPLIVLAGREYGTGSSRDQAARGVKLLGVQAILAESYERIHRSNLVGFGVLPLQFLPGQGRASLGLTGEEVFDIDGLETLAPGARLQCQARRPSGLRAFEVIARIDTGLELEYFRHGGLLAYVSRRLAAEPA